MAILQTVCLICFKITQKRVDTTLYGIIEQLFFFHGKARLDEFLFQIMALGTNSKQMCLKERGHFNLNGHTLAFPA